MDPFMFNTSKEKDQMKGHAVIFMALVFGPVIAIAGFATHHALIGLFGLVLLAGGVWRLYRSIKTWQERRRIKAEEAEIRAHQLRQARGQA
jgi:uncharacterized membrane protein HdeD (DUF308 family)